MGTLISAATQQSLIGTRHDLDYQINLIMTSKDQILNSINEMVANGADMEPDSPEVKLMEQRKQRLMLMDKKLELDLARAQNRLDEVKTNEQKVEQRLKEQLQKG